MQHFPAYLRCEERDRCGAVAICARCSIQVMAAHCKVLSACAVGQYVGPHPKHTDLPNSTHTIAIVILTTIMMISVVKPAVLVITRLAYFMSWLFIRLGLLTIGRAGIRACFMPSSTLATTRAMPPSSCTEAQPKASASTPRFSKPSSIQALWFFSQPCSRKTALRTFACRRCLGKGARANRNSEAELVSDSVGAVQS